MPQIVQHINPAKTGEKAPGISNLLLKLIALLAMLTDHIAWGFLPADSVGGQICHFIGRLAAPLMCFCLCEGYHCTRNLRKYSLRLLICAVASHYAYAFFMHSIGVTNPKSSMISTLMISLLALTVMNGTQIPYSFRLPVLAMLAFGAQKTCDWGASAVLFTLTFDIARKFDVKMQAKGYLLAAICYLMLKSDVIFASKESVLLHLYMLGIFLPIPFIVFYNGERGGEQLGALAKPARWFFYVFYPAHLAVLAVILRTG